MMVMPSGSHDGWPCRDDRMLSLTGWLLCQAVYAPPVHLDYQLEHNCLVMHLHVMIFTQFDVKHSWTPGMWRHLDAWSALRVQT